MRAVAAVIAGIVTGFVAMIAAALLGGLLFPAEAGVRPSEVATIFPSMSLGAQLAIILSWFAGALLGALIAKRIAGRAWAAWSVAAFFFVYVLATVLLLPMPGWMQAASIVAPLIGGLIANHLVADRTFAAPESDPAPAPEPDA